MATETVEEYQNGVLVNSYEVPIPDAVHNERQIRAAAKNAMQNNRDYAASTPTAAQTTAQVKALSRQMSALIRLQLQELGGTD